MGFSRVTLRRRAPLVLLVTLLLSSACLSSKSNSSSTTVANPTGVATSPISGTSAAGTGTAGTGSATPEATIISRPQPGATGVLMTGVIALNDAAPPDGSTLFLGLVKSKDDDQPRTCIDAENNPVNDMGQFYAQVACTPQRGDMLLYVLILGDPASRDWHRGVIPLPKDLTDFRIDTE